MKFLRLSALMLAATSLLASCVKKAYDAPPDSSQYDPALPVHTTLKNISSMTVGLGQNKWRQMGDTTVYGVVVADDRSGNYYKQIVIEDTSIGGMILYIDKSYLYADYPVGRRVYVKLKGLYLMNYSGSPEIVYSVDAAGNTTPIPSGLVGNYIVKGKYPDNSVTAKVMTLEELKFSANNYLNCLVTATGTQFATGSYGVSYAGSPSAGSATNRIVEDCGGVQMTLRNSNYSNFQSYLTPAGQGTLTCIVSTFNGGPQLFIRDTTDVKMTGTACR